MHPNQLRELLSAVANGSASVESAVERIRTLPYEDLGFAKVDHHRELRVGVPEVIFCLNKTTDQVRGIVASMVGRGSNVLATRMPAAMYAELAADVPQATYHEAAQILEIEQTPAKMNAGIIGVVSAGTSDIPVAEEAAVTARALGNTVERVYDVGVAGLHRLLAHHETLLKANCLIVVAGMEGALPSVVGGLVDCPVVGVPTSVGYGANLQGISTLFSMLNSCASGLAVVNVDNGFGAGYFAHLIQRQVGRPE